MNDSYNIGSFLYVWFQIGIKWKLSALVIILSTVVNEQLFQYIRQVRLLDYMVCHMVKYAHFRQFTQTRNGHSTTKIVGISFRHCSMTTLLFLLPDICHTAVIALLCQFNGLIKTDTIYIDPRWWQMRPTLAWPYPRLWSVWFSHNVIFTGLLKTNQSKFGSDYIIICIVNMVQQSNLAIMW